MDCNQNLIPLVFFHDVNGFMVGRDAEWSGIIKAGAKMVNAVSNSIVPKIVVIIGGSFGAGHYAMCGKAYDPRFVFAWPTARYAVMSGDSAAGTLVEIKIKQLERTGKNLSEEERKELYESVKRSYDEQADPRYGAARLWIDKIIDPIETRDAITQALEAAALNADVPEFKVGVLQMADSEEVLKELDPPDDVEIIGIVVNQKGAQRAINTNAVRTLGFPYSVSPTFLRNNQRQTLEEAIDELEKIKQKGEEAGLETVVYISMAFGNPYGDEWSIDEVVDAVDLLESYGIKTISLADTVGLATPQQIRDLVSAVIAKYHYLEIGVHLHSRPDQAVEDITAAYDAGCRRFDSALGGLG